jgi:hypothetical protein
MSDPSSEMTDALFHAFLANEPQNIQEMYYHMRRENTRRLYQYPPEQITRDKIDKWLKVLLPMVKRTSSRTPTCQLIASIERTEFRTNSIAYQWQNVIFFNSCSFADNKCSGLYEKLALTPFQNRILVDNPDLKWKIINRWEIKEETGEWILPNQLKKIVISEGGEALVIAASFGDLKTAVRIQAFDPLLFTEDFPVSSLSYKINLCSGWSIKL